jgi:hypothetical protein
LDADKSRKQIAIPLAGEALEELNVLCKRLIAWNGSDVTSADGS